MKTITLTLTEEEAKALSTVCARISGSPEKSRRGLIDSIQNKLSLQNINEDGWNDGVTGRIHFADS